MKEFNKNGNLDHLHKLKKLIEGIQVAMLTTMDEKGQLRSRPMLTQKIEENGDLWFFTNQNSPKVEEVKYVHQVNLVYSSGSHQFISVSGEAEVVKNPQKSQELWTPLLKTWFPEGLEDPQLVLLRVKPINAEYWDTSSNKFEELMGLAKAALTGKPAHIEGSDHQKMEIA